MRTRAVLLVIAILLVAAFAALNWPDMVRSSPLSFGVFVMNAPLGLILLGLLALAVIAFAFATGAIRTQALMDAREHHRALEEQRALAEKAEASRFTDLRTHFDGQLRDLRERDAIAATELQKASVEGHRELRTQLEGMNRMLAARLVEIEQRLDSRLAGRPVPPLPTAAQMREAELREDQLRQERVRAEQERARLDQERAVAKEERREEKTTSGWRRWF